MKKTNYPPIRQQFISRLLATFSIASLILLPLQFLPVGLRWHMDNADEISLRSWFPQGAPYWWMEIVPQVLVATLVLTAVFSLLNLRLLRKSEMSATATSGPDAVGVKKLALVSAPMSRTAPLTS